MQKTKYTLLSNRLHAIYIGLSADILFYIAISTIFLTSVKGLSDREMSLMNTIAPFLYLVFQYPALKLMQKVGNTVSIRIGCGCALIASVLITFATSFSIILLGEFFYQLSMMFKTMGSVILKNNLNYENKGEDFTKIQSSGYSYYSIITAVIALVVGNLYAINRYLPMYFSICTSLITFVLAFFIKDYGSNDGNRKEIAKFNIKIFTPLIICAFLSSVLFIAPLSSMQTNSDLLRKNILELNIGDTKTAIIASYLIFVARMVRILSCYVYKKTYKKMGKNIIPILYIMLFTAFSLIVVGGILPQNFIVKVTMISIGYCMLLACRDPYTIFEEDTLLSNTPKEYNQQIMTYMSFVRKVATMLIGVVITSLLGITTLNFAILFLYALIIVGIVFSFVYFDLLKRKSKNDY